MPNQPDLLVTVLRDSATAQDRASAFGSLWGLAQRRVWAITLPKHLAYQLELGSVISVTAPVPGLRVATQAIVVGEQVRSSDPTSVLQILV